MTTVPQAERIRVVWESDHDAQGNRVGRLVCPHGCTVDVTVHTYPAAASAVNAHVALHATRERHQEQA